MTEAVATSIDRMRGVEPGPVAVADALASQRRRLLELFRSFDDDQWQTGSRCSEWTVHDVVRHLVDAAELESRLLRGEGPRTVGGFIDPRKDPDQWLEASRGQSPSETVAAFEAAANVGQAAFDCRMRDGGDELVPGPYGPLHWTSLSAHLFWDAWLHERDIVIPLGLKPEGTPAEDRLAALYGLAVTAVAPTFAGSTLVTAIELTGSAPGVYEIAATADNVHIDFRASRGTPAMRAELGALVDSLAGRGPDVVEVVEIVSGSVDDVEPLRILRNFLRPPD